jgi:menaquinol-cytochrome c reductase iron-sulfur subunit
MPLDRVLTNAPEIQPPTRRGFYMAAIYAIWGAIAASLSAPALGYLFLPPKTRKDESWIDVGDITYITPNQQVEMVFHRNRDDGWKFVSEKLTAWVVKSPAGGVAAFGPQCTHLGCAHHWDESKTQFVCPCHNSVFGLDGQVTYGPAPRGLDRYETKLDGNKLLLGDLRQSQGASV